MTIMNLETVIVQLRNYSEGFEAGAAEALSDFAHDVLNLARVYVPYDTGALFKTGEVGPVEVTGSGQMSTYVRFGGPSSPRDATYAVIVHERLDVFHKPPTKAKYLEHAARELTPEMTAQMAAAAVAVAKARSGAG